MKLINFRRLLPILILVIGMFFLSTPTTLKETTWISSESDEVKNAIAWVELNSITDYDRIYYSAKYVNDNTVYKTQGKECFSQKPEDVLRAGEGDCVSFTKVVTAMLTDMDIPVQIMEGCVFNNRHVEPDSMIPPKDFTIPRDYFVKIEDSAGSRSIGESAGQLHSWIRAFDGETWWTIETTAGVVFPVINEEAYGYNKFGGLINHADPWDLCLLQNDKYIGYCMTG